MITKNAWVSPIVSPQFYTEDLRSSLFCNWATKTDEESKQIGAHLRNLRSIVSVVGVVESGGLTR
jgi:hypothetical protein